jgi:hypothetical protein
MQNDARAVKCLSCNEPMEVLLLIEPRGQTVSRDQIAGGYGQRRSSSDTDHSINTRSANSSRCSSTPKHRGAAPSFSNARFRQDARVIEG